MTRSEESRARYRDDDPSAATVGGVTARCRRRATVTVFELSHLSVHYGRVLAVEDVDLDISAQEITAFIGPSGCGKTTVLRCLNRMNDLTPEARISGTVRYHGDDLYGPKVDAVEVRRRIGMVFQKPNPFPKSIYDNVAYGPRINGVKRGELDDVVESALTAAALWDEVKDKLKKSALVALGRSAAAALHRPGHRGEARRHPDGRALLGARPDRHRLASRTS